MENCFFMRPAAQMIFSFDKHVLRASDYPVDKNEQIDFIKKTWQFVCPITSLSLRKICHVTLASKMCLH